MKKFAFVSIVLCFSVFMAGGQVPETDSLALVALYDSTDGAGWIVNTNWLQPGQPVSTWYGITVGNDSVAEIELADNNLKGVIPPQIGDLGRLYDLILYSNQLTGSIPVEICNLSNLETLSLYDNGLTGSIPPEIGNLTNLEYLILDYNQLTGPIPAEIGNLTSLKALYLFNNQLTDSIPPEIGNMSSLVYFELDDNELTGPIPPEIGNLTGLRNISLNNNQLEGPIPHEIGNLVELEYLHLQDNRLGDSIPHEIGNISSLKYVRLHRNQLSGSIPAGFGGMQDLTNLLLSDNRLSGPVPEDIKNIPSYCQFDIYNNYFTFSDLVPITGIAAATFSYSPQLDVAVSPRRVDKSTGDDLQIDISDYAVPEITAADNLYKWWLDDDSITPYSASPVLELTGLSDADSGFYHCSMINSDFPDLTLYTDPVHLVIDAPVDITLNPDSVDKNITPGYVVGTLSAEDPDQQSGHTFALIKGDGNNDLDNYLFIIDGTDLIINDSPDYEMKPEFHIYVRATDEDFKTFNKALFVYVRDLVETGMEDIGLNNIKIYPNPACNMIHIQLPAGAAHCIIELCDINGKTLYREERGGAGEIDISDYPAGIYYMRIIYNKQTVTRKIIKK
jgi:hypothetical protein